MITTQLCVLRVTKIVIKDIKYTYFIVTKTNKDTFVNTVWMSSAWSLAIQHNKQTNVGKWGGGTRGLENRRQITFKSFSPSVLFYPTNAQKFKAFQKFVC